MFTIPNQSSVPMAYQKFSEADGIEGGNRMLPGSLRDRLVDCMEEMIKYTIIMKPHFESMGDRYSERQERRAKELKAANHLT